MLKSVTGVRKDDSVYLRLRLMQLYTPVIVFQYPYHKYRMDTELTGACLDLWLKDTLSTEDKILLLEYADYISSIHLSFRIRFEVPQVKSTFEKDQIIKAVSYFPKESIVLCSFFKPLFIGAEAILSQYEGCLVAGAPEDIISTIEGKALKIYKEEEDEDGQNDYYYLLDFSFVANCFNHHLGLGDRNHFDISIFKKYREEIKASLRN